MFKSSFVSRVGSVHSKKRKDDNSNSTQRIGEYAPKDKIKKNGYMQQTANSFKQQDYPVTSHGSKSGTAQGDTQLKLNQVGTEQNFKSRNGKKPDREYSLTHISNSVSGFYRGDSASEVRSMHDESNYAQNIPVRK